MIRTFVFALLAVMGMSVAFADSTTSVTPTQTINLPPVGLGATETLEVNVANLASNSSSGTAASCTGTVTFFNAGGTAIGSAQSFTVTAGQSSPISLPFSSSGGTGTRTTVRAIVSLTVPTTAPRPPCTLDVSLALVNTSTGATDAIISGFSTLGVTFPGGLTVDLLGRGQ
jgi:hypothetical protein